MPTMDILEIIGAIFAVAMAPLFLLLAVVMKLIALVPLLVKWNTKENEWGPRATEREGLMGDEEREIAQ
ncbi:hypothetical protein K458DRAFT_434844 [Lentithecium fluviatile CBS 122367]|uniref:Uncharacterized protein n=1 Tax=Lentithecium fluviatile CBS 122367 TaxID=1168545 RepID=A0A6G1IP97_9PLEO|nr:hypothetical protein K458DRAFT_434844 [Lentithecium fluviatile CBS 122367]